MSVSRCMLAGVYAGLLSLVASGATASDPIPPEGVNVVGEILELRGSRFSNGSAGDLTLVSNANWRITPPPGNNIQFNNFVVNPAVTLEVPSGTVIRCRGDFVNSGTIVVRRHTLSGFINGDRHVPSHPGIGSRAAGFASSGSSGPQPRGEGGRGIESEFSAAQVLLPGVIGGGSGTGMITGLFPASDQDGGGTFVVLAEGGIRNTGHIEASGNDGVDGFGGGGGGVVVLASREGIDNDLGTVFAEGGNGGPSNTKTAPGGGGGGGIIHFLAPSIVGASNVSVSGGSAGAVTGMVTATPYSGGGGGGGSGGDGGPGSNANLNDTPIAANAGSAGYVIETIADPVSLF